MSSDRFEQMAGASSPADVVSILQDTDYGPYLGDAAAGSDIIENALMHQTADLYEEIGRIIPKGAKNIYSFYIKRWDTLNLKTILRGIYAGMGPDEISSRIIRAGYFKEEDLTRLTQAGQVEEFIAGLAGTPYAGLVDALSLYEKSKNLFFIEARLNKVIFDDLWSEIDNGGKGGNKVFYTYFSKIMDFKNLLVLLRAKRDKLKFMEIQDYLLSGGTIVGKISRKFDEGDMEELLNFMEGLIDPDDFRSLMDAHLEHEKMDSLFPLERVLSNIELKVGREISIKQPFGPGPILGFLAVKEAEVANIRAIARSKEVGLSVEDTRELLVGRE